MSDGTKKYKFELNKKKLEQLKKNAKAVRTGGKGAMRRTRKVVRSDKGPVEDTRVVNQLRRFGCQPVPEIEEVAFFLDDNKAKVFNNPKVHHAPGRGLFIISGPSQVKDADEVQTSGGGNDQLAELLRQLNLGAAGVGADAGAAAADDSDIPAPESFE